MPNRLRVVVAFTGMVAACALGVLYAQHTRRVKEALLKEDLLTMCEAIENYTMNEEVAPQSLEDLVLLHYLYEIPTDPVCPQMGWKIHFGESDLIVRLQLKRVRGLDNVFSSCPGIGANGEAYDTW